MALTGRVNLKLYKERVQLAEMHLKAWLTANPELRVMNTAFSALRSLERAKVNFSLPIRVVPQEFMALVPAYGDKGFLLF